MISAAIRKFLQTFNRPEDEDPLKNYNFIVDVDNFARLGFSKVSGVNMKNDIIEYREGGMNTTPRKSLGQSKFDNITLERGIIIGIAGKDDFTKWMSAAYKQTSKTPARATNIRRSITITPTAGNGIVGAKFEFVECLPAENQAFGDLDGMGNGDLLEKLVFAHEGYKVTL